MLSIILSVLGCDRDEEIRVYSAPKDAPQQLARDPGDRRDELHDQERSTTAPAFDGIQWDAPDSWILDPEKPMRVATFRASREADAPILIVTRFPEGKFGDLVANINRWRGQVGLDPIDNENDQSSESITVGDHEGRLFDLTGANGRSLVAMIPAGQMVWFFRFTGPTDAVGLERLNFDAFLKSVQFK